MAKAKSRTRARTTTVTALVPQSQRPLVINTGGGGGMRQRRSGGGRIARKGGGGVFGRLASGGSIIPVAEVLEGGGGGVLAGIIDDVMPAKWAMSNGGRALAVLAGGVILAKVAGMPRMVIAGLAGGVARTYYDKTFTRGGGSSTP